MSKLGCRDDGSAPKALVQTDCPSMAQARKTGDASWATGDGREGKIRFGGPCDGRRFHARRRLASILSGRDIESMSWNQGDASSYLLPLGGRGPGREGSWRVRVLMHQLLARPLQTFAAVSSEHPLTRRRSIVRPSGSMPPDFSLGGMPIRHLFRPPPSPTKMPDAGKRN